MKNKNIVQNLLVLIAAIAPFIYAYFIWDSLPERVALHFGIDGTPDSFGAKKSVLNVPILLMVVSIGVFFLIKNITKFDPKKAAPMPDDAREKMAFAVVLFMSGLSVYVLHAAMKSQTDNFIFVIVGLLLVVMGNLMHSLKPSYFIGIRLPWTLENAENWRKTHQFGSKIYVIGGLILLLAAMFVPTEMMVGVVLGVVAIIVIIPTVFSYREFKKNRFHTD